MDSAFPTLITLITLHAYMLLMVDALNAIQVIFFLRSFGVCIAQKLVSDYTSQSLDLGPYLQDGTDYFQIKYGAGSRDANSYNLQTHNQLEDKLLLSGYSLSGERGVFNFLSYGTAEQKQIIVITQTGCFGEFTEIGYFRSKLVKADFSVLVKDIVQRDSRLSFFSLEQTIGPFMTAYFYHKQNHQIQSITFSIEQPLPKNVTLQYRSLHEIIFPQIVKKLLNQNVALNPYLPNNIRILQNFVIVDYGVASVSAELNICEIKVNEVVGEKQSYNKNDQFFEALIKAKENSLVDNLPPIRNVLTQKLGDGFEYKIIFQLINPNTGLLLPFQLTLIDKNQQQPYFSEYVLDNEPLKDDLQKTKSQIQNSKPSSYEYRLLCKFRNQFDECTECVEGFKIMGDECVDHNCQQAIEVSCKKCTPGYTPSYGLCQKNDPYCEIFDENGKCISCFGGYQLGDDNKCAIVPIKCPIRYYFKNTQCQPVDHLCNNYDRNSGECLSCYSGYRLENGSCYDINCLVIEGKDCVECIDGYFVRNRVCVQVDLLCKTYEMTTGACTSCIDNYFLEKNGTCSHQSQMCKTKVNGICIECPVGKYLFEGICLPIDQPCSKYQQGKCVACFTGYWLKNGTCIDINCLKSVSNYCLECVYRYYPKNGVCVQVNYLCNTYNRYSGKCTSCFNAFKLRSNGNCYLYGPNQFLLDNCDQYRNGSCVRCELGYGLTPLGICEKVSNACKTIVNGMCLQCPTRFFFYEGNCYPVDKLCQTYNISNGNCLSCYQGYRLQNAQCIDINCLAAENGLCLSCVSRYFPKNGLCLKVESLCQTYDSETGRCNSCYIDYQLKENGQCQLI